MMGPDAYYVVYGDKGKTGVVLRQEAAFQSIKIGELKNKQKVRVDKVIEIGGNKLRAHVVGEKGNLSGWTTARLLTCCSGNCGRCSRCSHGLLPSEAAQVLESEPEPLTLTLTHNP